MEDYEIIIYATHENGMFSDLINNKFDVPITILGWGEKWVNYLQKSKAIYEYIKRIDNQEKILIVLDAFDTQIVNHPKHAIDKFLELGYTNKVLYSSEFRMNFIERVLFSMTFPSSCNDEMYLNAGMYMGRAKNITTILHNMIHNSYNEIDDQKYINKECVNIRHQIECDRNMNIFQNLNYMRRKEQKSSVIFVSYPGSGGSESMMSTEFIKRTLRLLQEHYDVLLQIIRIFMCIILIGVLIVLKTYEGYKT
jgi:hypothetical protein